MVLYVPWRLPCGATALSRDERKASVDRGERMKVAAIVDRREFDILSEEWNALLCASAADTIFLTWEWVAAWLDAVCPHARLLIITVRDAGGHLVAIAPFYESRLRLMGLVGYRCLRTVGDTDTGAEYPDVIVRPEAAEHALPLVARALLDARERWDCIWVRNIADWTGASERLGRLFSCLPVYVRRQARSFSAVRLPADYDTYLGSLSANARSAIRRQAKRVASAGSVMLLRCENRDELPVFLDRLFALHHQRWASIGEEGCFTRRPRMADFYRRFAPVAMTKGWLRIWGLELDGAMHAVQYGYVYNGALHQLQEGFDPSGVPGIGNVLREHVFKECIRESVREYDFLGEHTDHKARWGAQQRSGCDLFIGRRLLSTAPIFSVGISPTGRYLKPEE